MQWLREVCRSLACRSFTHTSTRSCLAQLWLGPSVVIRTQICLLEVAGDTLEEAARAALVREAKARAGARAAGNDADLARIYEDTADRERASALDARRKAARLAGVRSFAERALADMAAKDALAGIARGIEMLSAARDTDGMGEALDSFEEEFTS